MEYLNRIAIIKAFLFSMNHGNTPQIYTNFILRRGERTTSSFIFKMSETLVWWEPRDQSHSLVTLARISVGRPFSSKTTSLRQRKQRKVDQT